MELQGGRQRDFRHTGVSAPSVAPLFRQIVLAALLFQPIAAKIYPPKFPGLPSMEELAAENGLTVSHFLVPTKDGYLLMMHRLGNNTGTPVFLQHGLLNAADVWLSRGSKSDLVYYLLKEGYDVYLGNVRGNAFSKRHMKLKPNDPRFWDFTFHEMGYYDMPAMIDTILNMRKTDQLFYIGHSLGTTAFFVMTSTRPEYNSKIKGAILICPVAHAPDRHEFTITLIRFAYYNKNFLWRTLTGIGLYEVLPRTANTIKAVRDFCDYRSPTQDYCLDVLGHILGEHRTNINRKRLSYSLSFAPAGTSLKNIYHLGQVYLTSEFDYLDYGAQTNLKLYNSSRAPSYPLEKITAPVALFWSQNDNLVTEKSVKRIKSRLRNVVLDKMNPDPKFSHGDPVLGLNAKETLFDDIIDFLNKLRL